MKRILLPLSAAALLITACNTFEEYVVDVEEIIVSPKHITIEEGEIYTLDATIIPDNATDKQVVWISRTDTIASVDPKGRVIGFTAGVTSISATTHDGFKSDYCNVTVKKSRPEFSDLKAIVTDETARHEWDGKAVMSVKITNETKYEVDIVGLNLKSEGAEKPQRYLMDLVSLNPVQEVEDLLPGLYTYSFFARLTNGETYTSYEQTFVINEGPEK